MHRSDHTSLRFLALRVTGLLVLFAFGGCRSLESPLAAPTAAAPPQQRLQKFDPFPDTRIGPRVAGMRPPGYRKPVSEPKRWQRQAKHTEKSAPTTTSYEQSTPPAN
ncbi:MAG: hypothetical protein P8K78_04670 [Pirellulales bacterium]|nr:hypothetical protein [Pirellulales bacterium]